MKIIVDNKIPYIEGVFEPYAEVVYLPGHLTTAEAVKDADALVTRTRTLCSEEVLRGSKVKFIATATIGFDHIDIDYCRQAGIEWVNAPGCNAESVNQYMASALFSYAQRKQLALKGKTIGIVGVGQVGSRVAKTCEILGMDVLLNDPPRARREGPSQFVSLQTIRESADIVSFHVPLNMAGVDRTFHMVDTAFLQGLKRQPLIINTCRGEAFETGPVCAARLEGLISGVIVDCWENEPGLDLGFLNLTDYGTAHIAGYSKDGKANGTRSSVRAISRFFGLGIDAWEPGGVERPAKPRIEISGAGLGEQEILARAVLATYEIENDDRLLRGNPQLFEKLRGDYALRREFDSYHVVATGIADSPLEKLRGMGFRVGDK
ncbi:MAG: 4-phosphoerythronate dehydrogenase [Gammaproteobacteria bacterium]|nr:4-phosphoerythronate dehydrogenase [Gammaproteobacteria bacterium]NNL00112.1 4-phosphoerythronate dehydrogenase [Xanthomonadales bacterium]